MGLSVGVVSIEYSHNPPQIIQDFFRDLISSPNIGEYAGYVDFDAVGGNGEDAGIGYWCGSMDNVGILDVNRYGLTECVESWRRDRNHNVVAQDELLAWLASLPWKDGCIRLHLIC